MPKIRSRSETPRVRRALTFDFVHSTWKKDSRSGRFYRIENHDGQPLISPLTGTEDWPSVTHILNTLSKPALINWAATEERRYCIETALSIYRDGLDLDTPLTPAAFKASFGPRLTSMRAHEKLRESAAAIGQQTHKRIEWMLRKAIGQDVGREPPASLEALAACAAFEAWTKAHHVVPIRMEQTIWSKRYGFAGTFDLLASIDRVLTLLDFKTSKAIYPEMHLQNVAYQQALVDMGHPRPQRGLIVHIPKTYTPERPFGVYLSPPRAALMPTFVALTKVWKWWHEAEEASLKAWQDRKDQEREQELAPEVASEPPIF